MHFVSSATACPAPNYKTAFLSPVLTSQRAEVAFFVMWWHMNYSINFLKWVSKVRVWAECDPVVERLAPSRPWGQAPAQNETSNLLPSRP